MNALETKPLSPPDVPADALGDLVFLNQRLRVSWKGHQLTLSKGEYAVLRRLVLEAGHVVLRKDLERARVSVRLKQSKLGVNSTIKRLRMKFSDVDPDFGAIQVAYKIGYAWMPGARSCEDTETGHDPVAFEAPHRLVIDKPAYRATLHGRSLKLTPAGFALVTEMALRPGHFLDNEDICRVCGLAPLTNGNDPSQAARSLVAKVRARVKTAFPGVDVFQTAYGIGVRLHPDIYPSFAPILRTVDRSDGDV